MARSGQSPYYNGLAADYSRPGLVDAATGDRLLLQAEQWISVKEASLPLIDADYTADVIEVWEREYRTGKLTINVE